MMNDNNYVNIVGEGSVGDAAFTGNHQWMQSENCYREADPPETVTVIPVPHHGEVQFGSSSTIEENPGFVNDVVPLVLPVGYLAKKPDPICPVYSTPEELPSSFVPNIFNYVESSSYTLSHVGQLDLTSKYSTSSSGLKDLNSCKTETSFSDSFNHINNMSADIEFEHVKNGEFIPGFVEEDGIKKTFEGRNNNPVNYNIINYDDADLYDILNSCSNILSSNASATNTRNLDKKNNSPSTQIISCPLENSNMGIAQYTANAGWSKNGPCNEDSGIFSRNSSIYDSQVEKGSNLKQNYGSATGYSDKSHETNEAKRKRLKPGENPRPRPKDRQMIQDRVKELREIVPNGEKYSIDALLERTIKHMLFLQSVATHADKLTKDNIGGATCAYEVGSQSTVCPIVVEDLNQPRQMLIEMLCEERGIFLEIADIIRGLGLTILRGLMETRDDKIWAHFIVEANRNMTRIEMFLSLVHLFENGVPKPNNVNNESIAVGLS
ncbi:hypothetical protein ABFX02_14G233100 [Erythranthe guttata]